VPRDDVGRLVGYNRRQLIFGRHQAQEAWGET
jgi:hypothetical protein